MKRKLLITGGTGFIGRYIVSSIPEDKYQIILITRNIEKAKNLFKDQNNIKYQTFREDLKSIVLEEKPNIIVNLLGIIIESKNNTFYRVHFEFVKSLIDGSKKINLEKFIHISALGVYKEAKSKYKKTKALADEYIANSGIKYTIIRPSVVIGEGQKLFKDLKTISKFTPIILAPKGKIMPIHVLDLRDLVIESIEQKYNNQIVEVCGDKIITYKELFKIGLSRIGKKRLVIEVPNFVFLPVILFSKILKNPIMTLDQYYMLKEDNICQKPFKENLRSIFSI